VRAVLDVNVLIALLDPDHAFHERAHAWWATHQRTGWASCPITENGVVRIMSHTAYSPKTHLAAGELIARLRTFVAHSDHQFWADDLSIRDETALAADRIHGGRQITDLYLLALAVRHRGRLATFDTTIPLSTVPAAKPANMVIV
jgi:toxin-antitoxin system PIN domain toxin